VKNFQEHPQSILFTDSIRPVLQQLHPTEDYCIGQDSGIYWRIMDPPERSAEAPDWMAWQTAIVELGYTISDELYLTFIGLDPLPRLKRVGFRTQAGIAVRDCLTSPNPRVETPTLLIFTLGRVLKPQKK
jgi:hypothetical protein